MEVPIADVMAVHQMYGRQSHSIDSGHAADWAATFTADGEFHSPSYPAACGTAELVAFAERFHAGSAAGEVLRHVVSTVDVAAGEGPDALNALAYLQIIGTPPGAASRLHRITTLDDELVRTPAGWRIRRRTVLRDA
ncbi:hypothetical protein GCM10009836_34530 [Pseudonocardia ailaonensis]|uniref:SnoaL-like domain-containing protein n=1 Tax=Pseudonocardia ailaonensis TaxID=367279 RepID=A0ABN2N8A1_9PSEU